MAGAPAAADMSHDSEAVPPRVCGRGTTTTEGSGMTRRPLTPVVLLALLAAATGCASGGGSRATRDPVAHAAQTRRMYVSPGLFGAGDSLGGGLAPRRGERSVAMSDD